VSTLRFPAHAMVGSLGDFARVMAAGTEVPEEFYFAAGLTLIGVICAGSLRLNAALECEPRLYTLLLGESADVKKSTALRRAVSFFEPFWGEGRMPPEMAAIAVVAAPVAVWGAGSAEGLARKLDEAPEGVLLLYDEMQSFVEKSKVRGSVLLPMCASLFEQTSYDNATKAKHSISLRNAHLSFLGCCTTDTYAEMWTPDAIAIGFPNRLFVVLADRKGKVAWPDARDPNQLEAVRERIRGQLRRLPRTFDITPEAKDEWTRWYELLPSSVHAKRLDTIGFRLLPLIALTTDKESIDLETVKTVTAMLDYELQVRTLTDPVNADGIIAKLEEKIRRQLKTRGPLSDRDLRRYTNAHRYGLWAYNQAVKNLFAAKDVSYDNKTQKLSLALAA
jgi:hypothetical protein